MNYAQSLQDLRSGRDQTTIEKLWSGELAPCAQKERKHKEVRELVVMLEQYKRELEKGLDEREKKILEEMQKCYDELEYMGLEDAFEKGFSLGIKLVAEALLSI